MFTSYLLFKCCDIAWKLWNLLVSLVKGRYIFERLTLCFINVSCSSIMHAGSLIMYRALKVNREQSKVNIIQLSKTIILTGITWNKEKCFIHYQNWSLSTEHESTIIIIILKINTKQRLQFNLKFGFGSLVSCPRRGLFLLLLKKPFYR